MPGQATRASGLAPTAILGLICAIACVGCDRVEPPRPIASRTGSQGASAVVGGVVPIASETLAASDRPGAAALGAIEAGQAVGGAKLGGAPERTGGAEGAASVPARTSASP